MGCELTFFRAELWDASPTPMRLLVLCELRPSALRWFGAAVMRSSMQVDASAGRPAVSCFPLGCPSLPSARAAGGIRIYRRFEATLSAAKITQTGLHYGSGASSRSTVIEVQSLVLLNGPPSSGKSTLARRWVLGHPLALNLDIDVVRGLLGAWAETLDESGVAVCRLAIAMATTHLADGHDVIVPQFLAREQFIVELEATARATSARFIEIALIVSRAEILRAFTSRSAAPENQQHRDARELMERTGGVDALGEMHDMFTKLLETRPNACRVNVPEATI